VYGWANAFIDVNAKNKQGELFHFTNSFDDTLCNRDKITGVSYLSIVKYCSTYKPVL